MWHCPHCGAPQAETARCWVCRKSSTACSTCRHFRVSLAADLGYCALDRKRRPLTGLELRGCWTERPSIDEDRGARKTGEAHAAALRQSLPVRNFVPLDGVELPVAAEPIALPIWDGRTSLFGEPER
jgi:hypothetical protein